MTTIGYGDYVPEENSSRLITGLMSIFCIALFGISASVIGVGLSLQVQDNQLRKQQVSEGVQCTCHLGHFEKE